MGYTISVEKEKTDFERDVSEAGSFAELMLRMESKGVFVGEEFVSERILENVSDRKIFKYWFYVLDDAVDWGLLKKEAWLLGDLLSGNRDPRLAGRMVETVFSLISFVDSDRCLQNARISDILVLLMDSLEKAFPGILLSSCDGKGRNPLEAFFFDVGVGRKMEAAVLSGRLTSGDLTEIGNWMVENTGIFDVLCFLVQKAGFDPEREYSPGISLSSLVGTEVSTELRKKTVVVWSPQPEK